MHAQSQQPRPDLVSLAEEDGVKDMMRSIFALWEIVNNLTQLRASRRDRYRLTMFGSARVPRDRWIYIAICDLTAKLTRLPCFVLASDAFAVVARGIGTVPQVRKLHETPLILVGKMYSNLVAWS